MNKFNYAITGVSGFVGSNLVTRLLVEENTKKIYILTENSEKLKSQYSDFNNVVILNRDIENLAKHILKIDIFFMLGWGGSRGELRESYDVQKSSFDFNCRLLAISKKWGVNKVIFSGSQAEYGLTSEITSEKFDEKPITNYGKYKLRFKNYATSFCKDNGIKYAHLRFYSLYGHGDYSNSLVITLIRSSILNVKTYLTKCENSWNYLHISDAIDVLIDLSNSEFDIEIYNIASAETRKLVDFVNDIIEITNNRRNIHFTGDTSVINLNPDIHKISDKLNWKEKTKFKDGIEDLLWKEKKFLNS